MLTRLIAVEDVSGVGYARRQAQALAAQHGFDETDAGRVALLTTELASNLLKHAGRGELQLRVLPAAGGYGLEILSIDSGAGFDAARCLRDGYSTGGTQGIGLGALARLADCFDLYSDARGSAVLAQLYPKGVTRLAWRFGVCQRSMAGDPACGDAWELAFEEGRCSVLVVDGLGHGELAEQAASAGARAFAAAPFEDPALLMQRLHRAMSGSRGGAALVAQFDQARAELAFAGIGNISARLLGEPGRGLASHPGILGVQFRKAQGFAYPVTAPALLVLHSDGLQTRWQLSDYPGLQQRHPALVAAVLQRDYCRGRDDVTVVVIALEGPR